MQSSNSDDDLVAAMADVLSIDADESSICSAASKKSAAATSKAVAAATGEYRRASETSLLTSATSNWFTGAGFGLFDASAVVGGGGNTSNKKRVVGGGQGLLPPQQSAQTEATSTSAASNTAEPLSESKDEDTASNLVEVPSAKQILMKQQRQQAVDSEEIAGVAIEGDLKLNDGGNENGNRKKLSLSGSTSTVGISNVHDLLDEEERKEEKETEDTRTATNDTIAPDNDDDDNMSLDLADAVGNKCPDKSDSNKTSSDSQRRRSYPSITRHQCSARGSSGYHASTEGSSGSLGNNQHSSKNQGSSGSLGNNHHNSNNSSSEMVSSLKPTRRYSSKSFSSSDPLLKRQTSNQSNHSSGRSVQFKEDPDASSSTKDKSKSKSKSKSSFEDTAELYRQKYARCKNQSLWANLDRSIDTNVKATPLPEGKERSVEEQEKANELLRRRVRMCFAAMTVVFGDGIEDDPVESTGGDYLDESLASLGSNGDDVSVRSGMSSVSKRSRHGRRPSLSSRFKEANRGGGTIPTRNRPSIPVVIVRLLFSILIRRRGGLDLDKDFAQAAEADNASTNDSERRSQLAEARIDVIVEDVIEALASTLGLVDLISNYDGDENTTSGSSGGTVRRRNRNRRSSMGTDCAAIASRHANSLESEDASSLYINHDIHMLYGQANALYRPEIFFDNSAAFNRYLYKNHTTMASWDPEIELNYEMADACLAAMSRKHSNSPIGRSPRDLEYVYSLEAVPIHLLRSGRYHEVGALLSKESYVRRKLRKLGALEGAKSHISNVEEMNDASERAGNANIDMCSIFVASFTAMYDALTTAAHQAALKAAKSKSRRYEDRSRSLEIQSAEAFYAMGKSLQEHEFEDDAVDAYNHAMDKFDKVMLNQESDGGDRSTSDGDLQIPGIDHIHFVS